MRRIHLIAPLFLFVFFAFCTKKEEKRNRDINRIVFATGGCYGGCPVQVIDIDQSLHYRYQGIENTKQTGYFEGTISQKFWDALNSNLENLNYKQLADSYDYSVDDLSTEIIIYHKNGIKHIHAQSTSLPKPVEEFYEWFLKEIQQLEMTPTSETFNFPTVAEKPILEPCFVD